MLLRVFRKPFFLLLCAVLVISCKKNSAPGSGGTTGPGTDNGNAVPAITTVGTPIGTPVSKSIGASGGTLTSADGKLVLTIPAGALSANTNITIQPVTSTMPGSLGLSYDMLPNGTKFSIPVTLAFRYDSTQMLDKDPDFLFIAYQDSTNAWKGDATQRSVDTVAKTTTLSVSHFTIFDVGEWIFLKTSGPLRLLPDQTCDLSLVQSMGISHNGTSVVTDETPYPDNQIASWQVDGVDIGDALRGKVVSSPGAKAVFTAPAIIPTERKCIVQVVTKTHEIIYKNGKVWLDINPVKKSVTLTLVPYIEFNLRITYAVEDSAFSQMNPVEGERLPDYKDQVVFDVNLKTNADGVKELITNIKNSPPSVVPNHYVTPLITWDWIPDPYGEINVVGVTSQDHDAFPEDSILRFYVTHKNTSFPGFIQKSTINGSDVFSQAPAPYGGGGTLGIPDVFEIDLKKKPPYLQRYGDLGQWEYIFVVPIE